MSSLIEQLKADINATLGRSGERILQNVEIYGGEFTAKEIGNHSTAAPACLITCLGWSSELDAAKHRLKPPSRAVTLGFFILTKTANRTDRMLQAISIAERLSGFLIGWKPTGELSNGCVGSFFDIRAENLYGRASDVTGLGLWWVRASIPVSYCGVNTSGSVGGVNNVTPNLVVPTVIIESNASTHVRNAGNDAAETTAAVVLQQNINLISNDIGADDGHY